MAIEALRGALVATHAPLPPARSWKVEMGNRKRAGNRPVAAFLFPLASFPWPVASYALLCRACSASSYSLLSA